MSREISEKERRVHATSRIVDEVFEAMKDNELEIKIMPEIMRAAADMIEGEISKQSK